MGLAPRIVGGYWYDPSNVNVGWDVTETLCNDVNYMKLLEIQVPNSVVGGYFRFSYQHKKTTGVGSIFTKIYKNDVAYSSEASRAVNTYATVSYDLRYDRGDLIQLWGKVNAGCTGHVRNFYTKGDISTIKLSPPPVWRQI